MNNRGFAITTILYGILIIFCFLLVSMLGMFSIYKGNLEKLVESNNGTRHLVGLSFVNLIDNGDFEEYSIVAAPSKTFNGVTHTWDGTLNGVPGDSAKAYDPTGWYYVNTSVVIPEIGYHAHARILDDDNVVFRFKTNEDYAGMTKADLSDGITVGADGTITANRWLGVRRYVDASKLVAGNTYLITLDVYRVSGTNKITGGLYYAGSSSSTTLDAWNDGSQMSLTPTNTGIWETLSYTFTLGSGYNSSVNPMIYIYGYGGGSGEFYIDNVVMSEF